jgi:hypothetical protein
MPIITAFRRLRQEDMRPGQPGLHSEFKASLNYIARLYLRPHLPQLQIYIFAMIQTEHTRHLGSYLKFK